MYQSSSIQFRKDINGLRAWAVIAVLLFHFSLIGLPGGFAGVDVFFVISGYLMTAIIVGNYEKGHFSIWKFYMARVRRILPVLLVVIAVLLAFGWFWLPTPDYQLLGAQSVSAASFQSNIYYWRSTGYFDVPTEEKWLLHTWSLAVEAQFYLLYPIFIALVWHFKPSLKAITLGLLLLLLVSLALNLYVSSYRPAAAFYLLPMRGWELAAGGLVFLIAKQGWVANSVKKQGYWLGWGLIIVSFLFINKYVTWPSYWALFPVLGASLIILGQRENDPLTYHTIAQWLGDRSYSLYLWHWPLVVALYFSGLQNEWSWVMGALALSILFAHLSYQFIEIPTRQYLSQSKLIAEVIILIGVSTLVVLTAYYVQQVTFPERTPLADQPAKEYHNRSPFQKQCYDVSNQSNEPVDCFSEAQATLQDERFHGLLIGDSHADATFTAFLTAANQFNYTTLHWIRADCPTLKGAKMTDINKHKGCYEFNEKVFERLKEIPMDVPIVLLNRTNRALFNGNEESKRLQGLPRIYFSDPNIKNGFDLTYQEEFNRSLMETVCHEFKDRPVFLVRPIPEIGVNVPKMLSRNIVFGHGDGDIKITRDTYHQRNQLVWQAQDRVAKQCGAKILNPLPYLCDEQYCYGSKNGHPLYFDDDHLSEFGNKRLVPMFEEIFNPKSDD